MRAFWLTCLVLVASGASAQDTPTDVVVAYNDAATRGDWDSAASLVAQEDLEKLAGLAQLIYDTDPFTSASMGLDPDAAPADILSVFVGIAMAETPGLDDMVATAETEILGEVAEGDTVAHVVTRTISNFYGKPLRMIEVTTVERIEGRWQYRLSGEIDAIRAGMELAIEQPELFMEEEMYDDLELDLSMPRDPKKQ